ncbi:hypothetical protein HRG_015127 [Hirsutella rhossiliensis]
MTEATTLAVERNLNTEHLIHGHFQIPKGTVIVGTNFQNPDLRWAKTTDFNELERSLIGKPLPKLENLDDLKAALVEAGVM